MPLPSESLPQPESGAADRADVDTESGGTRPLETQPREDQASGPVELAVPTIPGIEDIEDRLGQLGQYRLLKLLGQGGMGAVYLAEDVRLRRRAAVKVMLAKGAADARSRERFLREARAAAAVHNDHVVTIYQVDEENGVPFLAMEYLQGLPLDEFLRTKKLPGFRDLLRIGREMATGLSAAHAQGLIHRDIKPGNIWLEAPNGRVKILDFGLARPVTRGEDDSEQEITRKGGIVGTPAYMSPEQGRGEPVDARTDLFSLGCVLYRLCTGKTPFSGPSTMAVLTALATVQQQPVRQLNPSVPQALSDLIDALLAKRAEDRPPSAQVVALALQGIEDAAAPKSPSVVYVPMAVPVQEESNPWTGIDEGEAPTEKQTEPPIAAAATRTIPKVAIGVAVAVIACAIAVLATAGKKPTTPTEVEIVKVEPKAPVNKKAGVGPKVPIDPALYAADRAAAEKLLPHSKHLTVWLPESNRSQDVAAGERLPAGPFYLTVYCTKVSGMRDDFCSAVLLPALKPLKQFERLVDPFSTLKWQPGDLEQLAGMPCAKSLVWLLTPTLQLTNKDLDTLKKSFPKLGGLHIGIAATDEAVIARLKELPHLERLQISFEGRNQNLSESGWEAIGAVNAANLNLFALRGPHALSAAACEKLAGSCLSELIFNQCAFEPGALAAFGKCKQMRYLHFNACTLTDRHFADIAELEPVRLLTVEGASVAEADLAPLHRAKWLLDFNLAHTKLSQESVLALSAALPQCRLHWLDGGDRAPKSPAVIDPERQAAEHLKRRFGKMTLRLKQSNKQVTVLRSEPLPDEEFAVIGLEVARPNQPIDFVPAALLPELAKLSEFRYFTEPFSATTWSEASLDELARLKCRETLTGFTINGRAGTEEEVQRWKQFPAMESLCFNIRSPAGPFLRRLRDLPRLSKLDIRGWNAAGNMTDDCRAALSELKIDGLSFVSAKGMDKNDGAAIAAMAKLQSLNFYLLEMTPAFLRELEKCASLRGLFLDESAGPGLTDEQLDALLGMSQINSLQIESTKLTDERAARLSKLQNLNRLYLKYTAVTQGGAQKLADAMPFCSITWSGGTIPARQKRAADPIRAAALAMQPHFQEIAVVRRGTNKVIALKPGDPLPAEPFDVVGAQHLDRKAPKGFISDVLLPAVEKLNAFESFDGGFNEQIWTVPELERLVRTNAKNALVRFNSRLTPLSDALIDCLKQCPKLTELECNATDADDRLLVRLAELPALNSLTIHGVGATGKLTARGWAAIGELKLWRLGLVSVKQLDRDQCAAMAGPALQILFFTSCELADGALAAFGKCKGLWWLGVTYGKNSVKMLREVEGWKHLRQVSWEGMPLAGDDVEQILKLPSLIGLVLPHTGVLQKDLDRLKTAMPHTRIVTEAGVVQLGASPHPDYLAAVHLKRYFDSISVRLVDPGKRLELKPDDPLPEGDFALVGLNYLRSSVPAGFVPSQLLPALRDLKELEALTCAKDRATWDPDDLEKLAAMPCRATLTKLTWAPRLSMPPDIDVLKRFPKLRHMGFLGGAADDAWLERLKELPALTHLEVQGMGAMRTVTARGWAAVAALPLAELTLLSSPTIDRRAWEAIATCKTLSLLRVYSDDVDFAALALSNSLKVIDLHWNPLTPEKVAGISGLRHLESLGFDCSTLTDACVVELRGLPKLKSIAISNSKVTEAGARKLAAALPHCRVRWEGKEIAAK